MPDKRSKSRLRQSVAIGTNPERTRAHNRRVVLEVIRLHGHLGRSAIADLAHLSPQAVANIVEDLLDKGMLVQLGRLRSGRGQPPIQFALNPEGPMTAGIEIAADRLVTVLMDLSGRMRAQQIEPLAATKPEAVAAQARRGLEALCHQLGLADAVPPKQAAVPQPSRDPLALAEPSPLLGVGVVMPGPFEIEAMNTLGPGTLPGWGGISAESLFAAELGLPVRLCNDATAAAVGERLYGVGQQTSDFCYLYFGVGLGLGIIQEGRPLTGAFGNAGEIGAICVMPRRGTGLSGPGQSLESIASVHALRAALAQAGVALSSAAEIEALDAAQHPALAAWIETAADYLAPAVALIENIFDPEVVVFGGGLPDGVMARLIAALEPLPVSVAARPGRRQPRVVAGHTGQLIAALGAASLPLLDTVSPHLSLAEHAG